MNICANPKCRKVIKNPCAPRYLDRVFCQVECFTSMKELAPRDDPGSSYFVKPKPPLNEILRRHSDAPFEAEGTFTP